MSAKHTRQRMHKPTDPSRQSVQARSRECDDRNRSAAVRQKARERMSSTALRIEASIFDKPPSSPCQMCGTTHTSACDGSMSTYASLSKTPFLTPTSRPRPSSGIASGTSNPKPGTRHHKPVYFKVLRCIQHSSSTIFPSISFCNACAALSISADS